MIVAPSTNVVRGGIIIGFAMENAKNPFVHVIQIEKMPQKMVATQY